MQTTARRERREEWARRVAGWRRSGLSAREFAERWGVNRHTLKYWAWRLGTDSATGATQASGARRVDSAVPDGRFVEVVGPLSSPVFAPTGVPRASGKAETSVEVVLRDGLVVRVEVGADAQGAGRLAALVAALEAR